jgi:cytochrome c oxidase subunit 2
MWTYVCAWSCFWRRIGMARKGGGETRNPVDHASSLAAGTLRNAIAVRHGRDVCGWVVSAGALLLASCAGPQSALAPAGRGAERIADLFWWMAAGAGIIWLAVISLAVYCLRSSAAHDRSRVSILIIGGGAALPTVVLTGLLAYGLSLMPALLAPGPAGSLKVAVSGEQWWWRVRYLTSGSHDVAVELANEIRLPVGAHVEFHLDSPDVIHSFWIPSIGGKIDMIPGRLNRLTLEPTRTGVFRGVCAEYCGMSHALMSFYVIVLEKEDFATWLEHQQEPAQPPVQPLAARGQEVFLANGCGACHTVRGTSADGVVGPDLTHVGSRLSLGAGILANEPDAFLRWIAHTGDVKPGVHMPAFGMLPPEDLQALAAYLDGLE